MPHKALKDAIILQHKFNGWYDIAMAKLERWT